MNLSSRIMSARVQKMSAATTATTTIRSHLNPWCASLFKGDPGEFSIADFRLSIDVLIPAISSSAPLHYLISHSVEIPMKWTVDRDPCLNPLSIAN